jgi:hypothetical protein
MARARKVASINIEESSYMEENFDKKNSRKRINSILLVLFVIAAALAGYFYNQNKQITADPNKAAAAEIKGVVEKVGKLMILPTGETPSMATVVDPAKLKSQAFFANAKAGDKVLLYTVAKKVILYNPTENRIIEAASLNLGNQGQ